MTINDGYSEIMLVDGVSVEYRPMLLSELIAVSRRVEPIADRESRDLVYLEEVSRHVVWSSGDWTCTRELQEAVLGARHNSRLRREKADCDDLYRGALMQFRYPALAQISCDTCRKWQVNPVTGRFQMRGGKRVERQDPDDLLCKTKPPACPRGSWEDPIQMSTKNQQALQFDLECRAVGQWPDDAIVRRNARIIGLAITEARRG